MHKMIPGKLYQHLDFEQTNLYEETSFEHIKNLNKYDIVLVIEKVNNTFKVLNTDGIIGVIYYFFDRWKEL